MIEEMMQSLIIHIVACKRSEFMYGEPQNTPAIQAACNEAWLKVSYDFGGCIQIVLTFRSLIGLLRTHVSMFSVMKFLLWLAYCCQTLLYSKTIMRSCTQPKSFSLGLKRIRISLASRIARPHYNWTNMGFFKGESEKHISVSKFIQAIRVVVQEWYDIPLETIQTLLSIPRKIALFLQRNVVPTSY